MIPSFGYVCFDPEGIGDIFPPVIVKYKFRVSYDIHSRLGLKVQQVGGYGRYFI